MHEYAIAEELIRTALNQLAQRGLGEAGVEEVHLRKGELCLLMDEALQQAYHLLISDTQLAGSKLVLEELKTEVSCPECGYRGPAEYCQDSGYHFIAPRLQCPLCRAAVEITRGRELELVRLVLQDDRSGSGEG